MSAQPKNIEDQFDSFFKKSLMPTEVTSHFGNTKKAFSKDRLFDMITVEKRTASTEKDSFPIAKQYLMTHFVKSSLSIDTVYFYEVVSADNVNITNTGLDILKTVNKDTPYYVQNPEDPEDTKMKSFNPYKWFMNCAQGSFRMTSDPMKPLFYEDGDTGQCFINLSKGFMHKVIVPYSSFSTHTKQKVQRVLDHLRKVWCSNDAKQYEYLLNWLSCAVTGHKRHTALFLKSGEGTGKSIIVEFINKYVIGEALGLITSRAQQLLGFNSMLLEKILVCLEELPSSGRSDWHNLSDILKDIITGGKISVEKKYEDMIQIVNYISLIIITNNDNTIKFGKDIRRYFMADISHDFIGNTAYFNLLMEACSCVETGKAMFMFMREHYEKIKDTFQETVIPETLAKQEMKERNSSYILNFIKKYYIKRNRSISDPDHKTGKLLMNDMRKLYNEQAPTQLTAKAFMIAVRQDLPILKTTTYGKNKDLYFEVLSVPELKAYFEQKGHWNDLYDKIEMVAHDKYSLFDYGVNLKPQSLNLIKASNESAKENKTLKHLRQRLDEVTSMSEDMSVVEEEVISDTDMSSAFKLFD